MREKANKGEVKRTKDEAENDEEEECLEIVCLHAFVPFIVFDLIITIFTVMT
jgi:hypothetical protein